MFQLHGSNENDQDLRMLSRVALFPREAPNALGEPDLLEDYCPSQPRQG